MPFSLKNDWQDWGFGIYLHWPFCSSKCPYCDFNSHVFSNIDEDLWRDAYFLEIERVAKLTGPRDVHSIFFGGGTPSLMSPFLVGELLEKISSAWNVKTDCEITLEANPTSVETTKLQSFKASGVNRISMGVQSLNDNDLKRLGRLHSAREALDSFNVARNIFNKTSFDLIYCRQNQTIESWQNELKQALDLEIDHLSVYQLSIEDGTAFGAKYAAGKLKGLPSDDYSSDLFNVTTELCEAHSLPAYEVSNHAKIGFECRHNLIYWNYGDYVGIGPGAHGRLSLDGGRYATESVKHPTRWVDCVSKGSGDKANNLLSLTDQGIEMVMMGMRLKQGIGVDRFAMFFGKVPNEEVISNLKIHGLITNDDRRLKVTHRGTLLLDYVLREILLDVI